MLYLIYALIYLSFIQLGKKKEKKNFSTPPTLILCLKL